MKRTYVGRNVFFIKTSQIRPNPIPHFGLVQKALGRFGEAELRAILVPQDGTNNFLFLNKLNTG